MTFRSRILIALAAVGVAPVVVLGVLSYRVNREELLDTVGRSQERQTVQAAQLCERFVMDRLQSLRLSASYVPFDRLTRDELGAVLSIPYRQLPDVNILAVLDARGFALAPPLFDRAPDRDPALKGHEAVDDADLEVFSHHVPLEASRGALVAVGPPYLSSRTGAPRVAVAFRVGPDRQRVLAAELSLAAADRQLRDAAASPDGAVYLVDAHGRVLAASSESSPTLGEDDEGLIRTGAGGAGAVTRLVSRDDGRTWLASYARVGELGWGVLMSQRTESAFRAAVRVRRYTLFWAAAAVALTVALGTFLARGLAGPVSSLSAAAEAMEAGRYDVTVPAGGRDELGRLGAAFNHMAVEVRRRDEEIRAWNAELQTRVEEKTAELRAAQDQIARSRRLAAVGSLGAGIAHGLNNPMTSIVGLLTVAREEAGAASSVGEMLETALGEAKRVTRIVKDLRELGERERQEAGEAFPLGSAVQAVVDRNRARLEGAGIELHTDLGDAVPSVQGVRPDIEQVIDHLVSNAITAMPDGGRLDLKVAAVEGDAVKLSVADTGCGVAPEIRERIFDPFFTTAPASRNGLGLSVSNRIVEAHHGRIFLENGAHPGACFTVVLPAAAAEAHMV